MGHYAKELYGLPDCGGSSLFEIILSTSFISQPSMCFRVDRLSNGNLQLIWNYEVPVKEWRVYFYKLIARRPELEMKLKTITDAFRNEEVSEFFFENNPVYSTQLTEEECNLFQLFYDQGLCEIEDPIQGLDGYNYKITFFRDFIEEHHQCWVYIPQEWMLLKDVLQILFTKAGRDWKIRTTEDLKWHSHD